MISRSPERRWAILPTGGRNHWASGNEPPGMLCHRTWSNHRGLGVPASLFWKDQNVTQPGAIQESSRFIRSGASRDYPKGIKVGDAEMMKLNIRGHTFQPAQNYTISSRVTI
jgi:hypothetical protein